MDKTQMLTTSSWACWSLLYVEDDPRIRDAILPLLQRRFGVVDVAEDGAAGLAAFSRQQHDIVLTDIQMPVLNGLQMIAAIRQQCRETPIVVTTAHNDVERLLAAINLGVNRYLFKPLQRDVLLNALQDMVQWLTERQQQQGQYQELLAYRARAEEELVMTRDLMTRMLRTDGLRDTHLKFWLKPAERFSGDLIAAQQAANQDLYLFLADATGHGLPAAISLLPLLQTFEDMVKRGFTLSMMVRKINRVLNLLMPAEHFVAAAFVRCDVRNRVLEVWNGGIPAPWFVDHQGNVQRFPSQHLALGIVPNNIFDCRTMLFQWPQDGRLYLCSDGVMEAENLAGEAFGEEKLQQAIVQPGGFECLVAALEQHLHGHHNHDDISIVMLDCTEETVSATKACRV